MAENHHIDPEPPPARSAAIGLTRLGASLLLLCSVIALYWKLALTDQFTWYARPENAQWTLPAFQLQAAEWHRGRIPLWDPNPDGGRVLAKDPYTGSAYPLNWVLFGLPLKDGRISPVSLNLYFVLIHVMGAWFAYKLARELGCSRWGAVAGGVIFTGAGWFAATESPHQLNGAVWAPLVFLYLRRIVRGRAVVASAALSGFFLGMAWLSGDSGIPLLIVAAGTSGWIWRALKNWRVLPAAAVFLIMAASGGALRGFAGIQSWPPPAGLAELIALPGAVTLSLAVLGVAAGWWEIGLFSLVSLLIAVGFTGDALMLLGLSAAMLAARGLDALLTGDCARWSRGIAWACLAFGVVVPGAYYVRAELNGFPGTVDARLMVAALAALLWSAAMFRVPLNGRAVALSALGLVLLELSSLTAFAMPTYLEKERVATLNAMKQHADLAEFLHRQPGSLRVEVDSRLIPYNFGDMFSIPQIASGATDEERRLMSAGFHIGKQPTSFYSDAVFEGASGLKVFAHAGVSPRVFASRDVTCAGEDQVELAAYAPNRVRISARLACSGMVVLNDTFAPGWRAFVDGKESPIIVAYGKLRGVMAPAGAHEVEFRYRPWSVAAAGLATALAALTAAAVARWNRG